MCISTQRVRLLRAVLITPLGALGPTGLTGPPAPSQDEWEEEWEGLLLRPSPIRGSEGAVAPPAGFGTLAAKTVLVDFQLERTR